MIGSLKTSLIQSGLSERRAGGVEVAQNTSPGVLIGIDSMFYQNAYPFTAVFRDPASRGQWQNHVSDRVFHTRSPLVFTPTHRLAKEMRARGVKAQTYHSFCWSGQTDWTPERMVQKFVPCVIICDEVCTVPCPTLQTFLDWLEGWGVQGICCGDQGQPPLIAGEMPHDWLCGHAAYYEEVEVDHRAKKKCGPGGVQAQTYHSFFRWSGQTDWTPERMGQIHSPCDHLGRGLRSALPHSANLPRLARGTGRPGHLLWQSGQPPPITGEMPHDWLRGHAAYYEGVEVDHSQKPSRSESAFSSTGSSAERCERRFLVASGGNASWRPGSHVISGLEAEGSRQGPEAAVRAP